MTPDQLAKSGTEHSNQVALFAWAAVAAWNGFAVATMWAQTGDFPNAEYLTFNRKPIPCLKWLHAIHNQGHGDAIRGAKAKAEGVRKGIPDIFLPMAKYIGTMVYHGLYIELKKPSMKPVKQTSAGGLSAEQIEFREYAQSNGYCWKVAYGWQEAAKIIQDYLS